MGKRTRKEHRPDYAWELPDGTTARMRARVVEATGDLAGLTGSVVSESTREDYPRTSLTLTYDLG